MILVYAPNQSTTVATLTEKLAAPNFGNAIALPPEQIFGWLTLNSVSSDPPLNQAKAASRIELSPPKIKIDSP